MNSSSSPFPFQSPSHQDQESHETSPVKTPVRLQFEEDDEEEDLFEENTFSSSPTQVQKKINPSEIIDKSLKDKWLSSKRTGDTQRIFLFPHGDTKIMSVQDIVFTSLPHPKTGKPCRFAIFDGKVMEINRAYEEPSSWFVDDFVQQDGSLYIVTPIDPLFLLIPTLCDQRKKNEEENHKGFFCDLHTLLMKPGYHHLQKVKPLSLSLITDVKKVMDETQYRLNDSKLIKWLQCKVDKLIERLTVSESYLSVSSAQSNSFRTLEQKNPSKDQILQSALGFVSEYVNEEIMDQLAKSFGIFNFGPPKMTAFEQTIQNPQKRKTPEKRKKNPILKKPKMTRGQAQLSKVNLKGISKISSFFGKK